MAWASGWRPPPVSPCNTRKIMSCVSEVAMPQHREVMVNPATQASRRRLRPNWFASHPEIGRTIAFDTRYEVTTHVPSSLVEARLPAMWGIETLTTVVSRTSMKVASITETVTTHGFTRGGRAASTEIAVDGEYPAKFHYGGRLWMTP